MLESGTTLGPYEVLAPLGAGGMGEVYRAKDTRLGREVAVKVLPQHLSDNADIRTRFEREAKTISALNHPNICTLFDVGREGDIDYLVMELVEGDTLAARLTRGALPTPELLRIGAQIADALDRAHRAGVVHRDLKPGNIMLTRSGAKLMDFGLARATAGGGPVSASGVTMAALTQTAPGASPLTAEGTLVGTFQYMAPEQLEGGDADARSDIWALGCVLYEMATGRRAFDGRSQASLIAAILEREPAPVADSTASATSTASGVVGSAPHGLDRLIRCSCSGSPRPLACRASARRPPRRCRCPCRPSARRPRYRGASPRSWRSLPSPPSCCCGQPHMRKSRRIASRSTVPRAPAAFRGRASRRMDAHSCSSRRIRPARGTPGCGRSTKPWRGRSPERMD